MTPIAPAASARPEIISLDILLSEVDEGRIQIPRFQRPYVWTPMMMRELFESVLKGFPIGSLLFWSPRESTVLTMANIGPLAAPSNGSVLPVSLVLDGHQRLATLYGVLRLPESYPKNENAGADQLGWWLGYDLKVQEPRHMRPPKDFDDPTILPLRSVLKTADFVRFARTIDRSKALSEEDKILYIDRADGVQRALRDYRVALTVMRDGTVDDAVQIFSRVNRSGRRMTTDQMAVALTYHEGFNLEDTLDEILRSLGEYGFADVSRKIVLQTLLQRAGRVFVTPKFDDLRTKETQETLRAAVPPATEALCSAARFFNQVIGFSTGRLLPYALQLLLLAVFFGTARVRDDEIDAETGFALTKWFWATSFSGWFASANTSEVAHAVEAMEAFARSPATPKARAVFNAFFNDRPLRRFPKTFDRRSARIRSMLLVEMARGKLLDPITGDAIDGSALLSDPDHGEIPYVFLPDGKLAARSPANRVLLAQQRYGSSAGKILAKAPPRFDALESHGINEAAHAALLAGDIVGFVQARELLLQSQEESFLGKFDLRLGDVQRSEEEHDVDDD